MKKMKKICSVFLALLMVLTMLAGCDSQPAKTDQDLAKEAVENYLDALMKFDFKKASEYTTNPEKMMENSPYGSTDEAIRQIMNEMPAEFQAYESDIREFATALFDTVENSMSYEITNIKQDGDKYTAEVTMVNTADDLNLDSVITDMMEEADLQGLLVQYMEDGIISVDMSEQELYDILFPAVFDKMTDSVKNLTVETTTAEESFDVISVDGKWVVDVTDFE